MFQGKREKNRILNRVMFAGIFFKENDNSSYVKRHWRWIPLMSSTMIWSFSTPSQINASAVFLFPYRQPFLFSMAKLSLSAVFSSSDSSVSSVEDHFPSFSACKAVFRYYMHLVPVSIFIISRSRTMPVDVVRACYGHIEEATAVVEIPTIDRDQCLHTYWWNQQLSESIQKRILQKS